MTERTGKKEESRARILASAGRGFRSRGYDGLGVDELAKQAGVTSGAFYAHFNSKAAAFREAVRAGMEDLRAGLEHFRRNEGDNWLHAFIDFYMGERRRAALQLRYLDRPARAQAFLRRALRPDRRQHGQRDPRGHGQAGP